VLGALTTVNVNGVNYTTRTTSPGGNWSVRLNGLPEGSYTASITVYDGYLTGTANLELEVNPGPPTIDLRITRMGYESGTFRIQDETGYALTGEPVVLKALVRNDGNTGTGPFDVAFIGPEGDTIGVSGPVTLAAFSQVWVTATQPYTAVEGPQTLKACADSGNVIEETNENNNERSCVLIGTDDLPDLRPFYYLHGQEFPWNYVSGLSFNPVHPLEYQPVTVNCDIYNSGTSAVPEGATFEVSFKAEGEEFATNTIILDSDLVPGASIQTSAIWSGGSAGAVVFSFHADTENAIAELDEDNNNTSRTLVVYPMADDLGFSALSFSPMQPLPEADVNLTATVRNNGGLPGGNGLPVEFFIGSTDPEDKIGETILNADVAPFGGMRNVTLAWTAPEVAGNYPIFAKINDAIFQSTLRVTNSPAPNLQVYSEDIIATPLYPSYGDTVSVKANVRNTEGSAAVDFMVRFYEDIPTGGWAELGTPVSVASLAVGSQITVDATATLIANRAAYSIKVVLVPNPEQGDANESDNQATSSFLLADAPVADAGEDIETLVGQTITLDGTGSSNAITYAWTLTAWPQGSAASLSGANTALPQLTPDMPGTYTARLIVSDGTVMSLPDFVNIYAIGLPLLTTAEVTGITATTATIGGNITNDGGAPVTTRGVVWSTIQNPTIETNEGITYDGEGTGSWVSELVGLTPGTQYFIRAYATNSAGTAYGEELAFTTLPGGPPNWEPNPYFQYNMQIIGQFEYEDGTISMNGNDIIGAFVGEECRGVMSPDPGFMGIIFLTVGSDQQTGEAITFKAYLADEDMIVELNENVVFENQQQIGSIPDPFIFSYGDLISHTINLPSGWSGLSSYLIPAQPAIEDVFEPIANELIIAQTMTGMYYPGQNINNIGNWESHSAFKVKTNTACMLEITGEYETNLAVSLNAGWNLLPVVTPDGADPADLFMPVNGFVIAKDVAGTGVFWPQYNINSIGYIFPGKAFYVLMTAPGVVDYTGMKGSKNLSGLPNLTGLESLGIQPTPSTHTIVILPEALKGFEQGTIIGAYDQAGNCFGAVVYDSEFISLTVFGDDPTTAKKDGFFEGEMIFFKNLSGLKDLTGLNPTFDPQLPSADGLFTENGLSVITGFETVTGIGYEGFGTSICIFPNPTDGLLSITGLNENAEITITDVRGQKVLKQVNHSSLLMTIDLTSHKTGVYLIKIEQNGEIIYRKLVLR
jgi:hypothetical protein